MIAGLITTVTGTRSRMRPLKAKRKWNTNGTQMERIDDRVPDEFQTLFLLGYF